MAPEAIRDSIKFGAASGNRSISMPIRPSWRWIVLAAAANRGSPLGIPEGEPQDLAVLGDVQAVAEVSGGGQARAPAPCSPVGHPLQSPCAVVIAAVVPRTTRLDGSATWEVTVVHRPTIPRSDRRRRPVE